MSFQAMTWVSKQRGIPAAKKCLLFSIANYAGHDGTFWPSYQTLADDAGLSRRSVMRYMAEFEREGVITLVARRWKKNGDADSSLWRLNLIDRDQEKPAVKAAQSPEKGSVPESPGSDTQSPPSDRESPGVVTGSHQGSDTVSPKPVTEPYSSSSTPGAPVRIEPHRIPEDWEPLPETLDQVVMAGVPREFAESLVDEFRHYWRNECPEEHKAWGAKFRTHAVASWRLRRQGDSHESANADRAGHGGRGRRRESAATQASRKAEEYIADCARELEDTGGDRPPVAEDE